MALVNETGNVYGYLKIIKYQRNYDLQFKDLELEEF